MTSAAKTKVFISYARKDGTRLALRLQKDLTKEGFHVWLDTKSVQGGAKWAEEIERAIDDCEAVLAVLTPGSYTSDPCRAEQTRSLDHGKPVIPLLGRRGSDVPLLLQTRQYRDFTSAANYQAQLRLLIADLRTGKRSAARRRQVRQTPVQTVPPLPGNYLERQDAILHLRERILGDGPGPSIALIAVRGMGGIGKTVLAQALCRDEIIQQAFPDGILWTEIGKDPSSDLITRLHAVRRELGEEPDEDESELECIQRYRAVVREKAALIVVDDVWRTEDIEPFLVDSPRSRLLFTTRNADIVSATGAVEVIADLLTLDQSRAMLARYAGLTVRELPSVADDLIGECGHLPLALSMIGAMLRGSQNNYWPRVLHLLRGADLARIKGRLLNYPHENLLRPIQVSVDALDETARNRYFALAVLLNKMAAPPSIQQALWDTDEFGALDTSEQLVTLSLAQRDSAGTGIVLHDLQLDYVRFHCPDRAALDLIHEAVRLSASVIQKDPVQFASQMVGRLLPRRTVTAIDQFIDTITKGAPLPWLRPILPALDPPGRPIFPPREGHRAGVLGVALTKNGQRAISVSEDETLKCWDVETARELFTLRGHRSSVYSVALSADGRCAISASSDKSLKIWDLDDPREVRTLVGHSRGVSHVVVSPDFRRALSASWDSSLKLWDTETGVELGNFKGHSKSVNCVAVNAEWTLAVSASEDATLRVWNLKTGRQVRALKGHSADVWSVALTSDGKTAVSASEDQQLKVWSVTTGRVLRTLKGHTSAVYGVAVSPDNRFVVSASDDTTVRVWSLSTGRQLHVLRGHSTLVHGVAVSDDSRFVISASYDATLKVWDLETGVERRTFEGHSDALNAVAVSVDDTRAVSASADETVRIWDLEAGTETGTLRGHTSFVQGVAVSADFRLAVSASDDKTVKIWNLETAAEIRTLSGHDSSVFSVALAPDGKVVASASYDATVRIWDVASGRERYKLTHHSQPVNVVVLTPDGRLGVSASDDCLVSDDGTMKVWEVKTGRLLRNLGYHSDSVSYLAFSPDGAWLVSASWDKMLKVWDFKTGSLLATFTSDVPILCCKFIQNKVIAGDHLGRIHLLSLELDRAK